MPDSVMDFMKGLLKGDSAEPSPQSGHKNAQSQMDKMDADHYGSAYKKRGGKKKPKKKAKKKKAAKKPMGNSYH